MPGIALISQIIDETLRSQTERVKHDPKYNLYTAELLIKELRDFRNNVLQPLFLANDEETGQPPPMKPPTPQIGQCGAVAGE